MKTSIEQRIKKFEVMVEKNIKVALALALKLEKLTHTKHPQLSSMLQMPLSAYHASENMVLTMFKHNYECASKVKTAPDVKGGKDEDDRLGDRV